MASTLIVFVALALCIWCTSAQDITPCDLKNYTCIGGYMNRASGCSLKTRGEKNFDPRNTGKEFSYTSPSIRNKVYMPNTKFIGARSSYFTLFFHELVSGRTVLQAFFPQIKMSGKIEVSYNDTGSFAFTLKSTYESTYRDLTLTTEFSGISTMNLDNAKTTAKLGNIAPVSSVGKRLTDVAKINKRTAEYVNAFTKNPQVVTQELFDQIGHGIMSDLIYHRLCDYHPGK